MKSGKQKSTKIRNIADDQVEDPTSWGIQLSQHITCDDSRQLVTNIGEVKITENSQT